MEASPNSEGSPFVSALHQRVTESSAFANTTLLRRNILQGGFTLMKDKSQWYSPCIREKIFLAASWSENQAELDLMYGEILTNLQQQLRKIDVSVSLVCLNAAGSSSWDDYWSALDDCCKGSSSLIFLLCISDDYGDLVIPRVLPVEVIDAANLRPETRALLEELYEIDSNHVPPSYVLRQDSTALTSKIAELASALGQDMETVPINNFLLPPDKMIEDITFSFGQSAWEWVTRYIMGTKYLSDLSLWLKKEYDYNPAHHAIEDRSKLVKVDGLLSWVKHRISKASLVSIETGVTREAYLDKDLIWTSKWKVAVQNVLAGRLADTIRLKREWDSSGCGLGLPGDIADEMLHHSHLAYLLANKFAAQNHILQQAINAVNKGIEASEKAKQRPASLRGITFALVGKHGSGKSTLLAKLADTLYRTQSLQCRPVIMRFCGTSLRSRSIVPLIISICHQINFCIGKAFDPSISQYSHSKAVKLLQSLLNENAVILIIDAVNDLSNQHLAKTDLAFLQGIVPHTDTKIILSTDSDEDISLYCFGGSSKVQLGEIPINHGCESKLRSCKVPVITMDLLDATTELGRKEVIETIKRNLNVSNRSINDEQFAVITSLCEQSKEISLLYLSVASTLLDRYNSSTSAADMITLPKSLDVLIDMYYIQLEVEFGKEFVGIVLGLIATSVHGIREVELIDLLMASDRIISLITITEVPKNAYLTNLWLKLKSRVQQRGILLLLVESASFGAIRFLHTHMQLQFTRRLSTEFLTELHKLRALYFGNILPQSFYHSNNTTANGNNANTTATASDRYVCDQPLVLNNVEQQSTAVLINDKFVNLSNVLPEQSNWNCVWVRNAIVNVRRSIEAPDAMLSANLIPEAIKELCNIENCCARVKCGLTNELIEYLADLAHKSSELIVHHYLRFVLRFAELEDCSHPPQHLLTTALLQPKSSLVRQEADELMGKYVETCEFAANSWIRSNEFGMGHDFDELLATFKGHTKNVLGVDISRDGRYICSCSEDSFVRYWDAYTGQCLHLMEGHKGSVHAVAFDPSGARIVSGGRDKAAKVWDVTSGLLLISLDGHKDTVQSVCYNSSGTLIATGSKDKTIRLWDNLTGNYLYTLDRHCGVITCVCFCGSDTKLLSGSEDDTICLWETSTQEVVKTFEGHKKAVTSISTVVDGSKFVSASRDKSLRIWNAITGETISVLERHSNRVTSVSISGDGSRIVSACDDNHILLWDTATCEVIKSYQHQPVTTVRFDVTGDRFVSGSFVKTLSLWDARTVSALQTKVDRLENVPHCVMSICFTDDNQKLITGNSEASIYIWDCATGTLCSTLGTGQDIGHDGPVTAVCSDKYHVISGSADHTVMVWSMDTGDRLSYIQCNAAVTTVSINEVGTMLAVGAEDRSFRIFDYPNHQNTLYELEGHKDVILCSQFSYDGSLLVAGAENSAVYTFSTGSGNLVNTYLGHSNRVNCVSITRNGFFLVSGSSDKTVRVWTLREDQPAKVLKGHSVGVSAVAIGCNDSIVVSGSIDKTLRVWSIFTGELINVLVGHTNKVTCLSVCNNGKLIASGSSDKKVRLWDSSNGETYQSAAEAV